MKKKEYIEKQSQFDDVKIAHQVIEAVRALGNNIKDGQSLIQRMRHVEYGLNAETECSAVLSWLGNCNLVQKLTCQGYIPEDMKVPDLFAVFKKNKKELKAFIEVKSTNDLMIRWNNTYHSKLTKYCDIYGLPLLIAWKARPFGRWLLLDATDSTTVKNEKIDLCDALPNNLMGIIAGDFSVTPKPRIGLHIEAEIIHKEKRSATETNIKGKIIKCFWGDQDKNKYEKLNESEIAMIMTMANKEYYEEEGNIACWGYVTPNLDDQEHSTGVFAQDLLRFIVGFSRKIDERIAWGSVLRDLNEIKTKEDLLSELSNSIGSTVRYIFHQIPRTRPAILNEQWYK